VTFEPLRPSLALPLAELFAALRAAGDERWFHPHPLTDGEATRLCGYAGRDFYAALVDDGRVVAYGMLRGWDEGFDVPSLGLAVHPDERGHGLGRTLLERLHEEARRRGAARVRLTVERGNTAARRLYVELGYELEQRGNVLVGMLPL
jgi:ribosomal protein S18 acetylase RimI-like enzyme